MESRDVQQDLDTIRKMVAECRRSTARVGDIYIVWGVGVLAALLGEWWSVSGGQAMAWTWWLIIGGVCTLYTLISMRLRRGDDRVVNFSARVTKSLWGALTAAIWGTAMLGSLSGAVAPVAVLPLIAILVGIGMIVTGSLFRTGLFTAAGWLWLVGGLALFFAHPPVQIVAFGGLDIVGYILPGVYLVAIERRRSIHA